MPARQHRARASASGTFDYRVVARRLEDVGKRLEKVDVPDDKPRAGGRDEPQRPPDPKKPEGIN